jgi:hypothetical protein
MTKLLATCAAALLSSGCCATEGRTLDLEWEQGPQRASLELNETRGKTEGQYLMWYVRSALPGGVAVAEVTLRQESPGGQLLYRFPLETPTPYADVATQVFTYESYERATGSDRIGGLISFDQLWDRVESGGRVFIQVRYTDGSVANLGPLALVEQVPWQNYCT